MIGDMMWYLGLKYKEVCLFYVVVNCNKRFIVVDVKFE